MKIKVAEATPLQLDWMVAKIELPCKAYMQKELDQCWINVSPAGYEVFMPTRFWAQGGPIIERERLSIIRCDDDYGVDSKGFCNNKRIPEWCATTGQHTMQYSFEGEVYYEPQYEVSKSDVEYGQTPLIAAMRCYVVSKLGEEVEVPDELI